MITIFFSIFILTNQNDKKLIENEKNIIQYRHYYFLRTNFL